jgi:hypothetical protein
VSGGRGINIGLPEDNEEPDMPSFPGIENWYLKLSEWMRFWKSCKLTAGQAKTFCRWTGSSCCYNNCPARVFEEVKIGLYPEENIPEPTMDRVRRVDEEQQTLKTRVNGIAQKQNNQFKKINQELKAIKEEMEKE